MHFAAAAAAAAFERNNKNGQSGVISASNVFSRRAFL
jgi:hypothetical protein